MTPAIQHPDAQTERLDLHQPAADDVDAIYAICGDPRVWTHYPSKRHTERAQSARDVARWMDGWAANDLDTWIARENVGRTVIGYGGCSLKGGVFWNLGYRIAATAHGHGYATELSREAVRRAREADPALPVVAYLLEHNAASEAVARKLGMTLVNRGPDAGNPDPAAVRLVYADRPLGEKQLAAVMH